NDDLIKRVIGLPGEFVDVEDGRIEIDGGLLLEPYLPLNTDINSFIPTSNCFNRPNENSGCRIPDGHVFVMGDNRSNSRDSRYFGPVPIEDVEGRAFIRVWPATKIRRL
ncbi:MAG: signal peptidase I, partial [Actinomycetota bacterium]|nr:signal peptidase I [Actinomycetota bacterium]